MAFGGSGLDLGAILGVPGGQGEGSGGQGGGAGGQGGVSGREVLPVCLSVSQSVSLSVCLSLTRCETRLN